MSAKANPLPGVSSVLPESSQVKFIKSVRKKCKKMLQNFRRHRFAEKNAEDLQKLRQELTQIT